MAAPLKPALIQARRVWFANLLAEYPVQPVYEAHDVDALIALMLTDRFSFRPFVETIHAHYRDIETGRTNVEGVPSLKNCMLRNWRAVHGVGVPVQIAA